MASTRAGACVAISPRIPARGAPVETSAELATIARACVDLGDRALVHDVHRAAALARLHMMPTIEDTIDRVERLYTTITGHRPPHVHGDGARLPPEIDPAHHVEAQLAKLVAELERGLVPGPSAPAWIPRAFAWRDETGIELAIDVPGVRRDQLELAVDDRVLVVRGHRTAPWGDGEQPPPVDCEAPFGAFARAFALPERVGPSQVSARLDAGTLRVRIARGTPAESLQVPISCS